MISFEKILTTLHPVQADWCRHYSRAEFAAYFSAVDEAFALPHGATRLVGSKVSFRNDLAVDYLGKCDGPDGSTCHVLLLRLGDDLDVVACLEDDGSHGRLAYRGRCDDFQQIAAELRAFDGRCFVHLRDAQVAA